MNWRLEYLLDLLLDSLDCWPQFERKSAIVGFVELVERARCLFALFFGALRFLKH